MEAISSFVFHRCRSPGKKSVFGIESRASESRFMASCVLWFGSVGEGGKKKWLVLMKDGFQELLL